LWTFLRENSRKLLEVFCTTKHPLVDGLPLCSKFDGCGVFEVLQRQRSSNSMLWLGAIVGLVGVFGIGHLFLGRTRRGLAFLGMTALLAVYVLVGPLLYNQLWQSPASPTVVFGVLWLVQTYDLYRLTKRDV
jgi:hypothetical protein